jgi:hypothetical protein
MPCRLAAAVAAVWYRGNEICYFYYLIFVAFFLPSSSSFLFPSSHLIMGTYSAGENSDRARRNE